MCSASAKDLEDGAHENNNNNLPLSESIIFFNSIILLQKKVIPVFFLYPLFKLKHKTMLFSYINCIVYYKFLMHLYMYLFYFYGGWGVSEILPTSLWYCDKIKQKCYAKNKMHIIWFPSLFSILLKILTKVLQGYGESRNYPWLKT